PILYSATDFAVALQSPALDTHLFLAFLTLSQCIPTTPASMKTTKGYYCKVYYSLLALCYLEVVLWTFCLLASCAAPVHGHNYLIRETQTLKLATRTVHPAVVGSTPLRQPKLLWRFERKSVSVRNAEQTKCYPRVDQAGLLAALRGFPEFTTGLPAPYTGIKAIS
ncbi:hypothetical protein Agub_g9009, partial [Astrephomene gubernaculifera]